MDKLISVRDAFKVLLDLALGEDGVDVHFFAEVPYLERSLLMERLNDLAFDKEFIDGCGSEDPEQEPGGAGLLASEVAPGVHDGERLRGKVVRADGSSVPLEAAQGAFKTSQARQRRRR